jgi:hypothetical protein
MPARAHLKPVESFNPVCVIIVDPHGTLLDLKILANAVERNPNGHGMVVLDGDNIITHHGFGFKSAKKNWIQYLGMPRVFHARVRTCGEANIANCHPFDASCGDEKRWLFHNGQLGVPRLNDKMSDSWHFAQYLRNFKTNDDLYKALDSYAIKERSRFTLVTPGKIHMSGDGWFHRDGVSYSSVSALANIVADDLWRDRENPRMVFKEGYLTDTSVEVTSDKSYDGLHWDNERKLYSNRAPAASAIIKASRFFIDKGGTRRYIFERDGQDYFYDSVLKKEVAYDPKLHNKTSINALNGVDPIVGIKTKFGENTVPLDKEDEKTKERRIWAGLQKEAILIMCRAPWMRSNYGNLPESLRSYPRADANDKTGFRFGSINERNGFGNLVTFRFNSGKTDMWTEVQYENGQFMGRVFVDGPYKDGLLIRNGSDEVKYGKSIMSMDAWREIVISSYFREVLDYDDTGDNAVLPKIPNSRLEDLAAGLVKPRVHVVLATSEAESTVIVEPLPS